MSASYRLIAAAELDAGLIDAWRSIQSAERVFASPYFCPEFTQAVGAVRDDVRIAVIEKQGRAAGFFPHLRTRWGTGRPVGGPLSDFHGVIARPDCEWQLDGLMRAARLSVWTFDHLVGGDRQFAPYVTGGAASPQIDLTGGYESYARERRASGSEYIPRPRAWHASWRARSASCASRSMTRARWSKSCAGRAISTGART